MINIKAFRSFIKQSRKVEFEVKPKPKPGPISLTAEKRQRLALALQAYGQPPVIRPGEAPESQESCEKRKYFHSLNPYEMTDAEVNECFDGLKAYFKSKRPGS